MFFFFFDRGRGNSSSHSKTQVVLGDKTRHEMRQFKAAKLSQILKNDKFITPKF